MRGLTAGGALTDTLPRAGLPPGLATALAALDRRLDAGSPSPVAVAVSGGSDSLGLLALAGLWAGGARRRLLALTVDHQLHPDSGRWTAAAGEAARRNGADWRPLAWTGPKPATGLPAAARRARHALLADAAREAGARVLLLGHTADDTAESALIRAETPTHGRLAEWSPSPAWPQGREVFLLRPLLAVRRAELRGWLAAQGIGWLDDPANIDPRFARARARATLAQGARPQPSATPCACACKPRGDLWTVDACGGVELPTAELLDAGGADRLARALLCASGQARPPSALALARLFDGLNAGTPFTATLAGAQASARTGRLRLTRELGRRPPSPRRLAPDMAEVFDGRFQVVATAEGWRVAPLAGHAAALPRRERAALRALPADARPALPVLLGPDGERRLPAPFGEGPAQARSLVAVRLEAAWGLIADERALELACRPPQPRGAGPALVLS